MTPYALAARPLAGGRVRAAYSALTIRLRPAFAPHARLMVLAGVVCVALPLLVLELHTGFFQSRVLHLAASCMTWRMGAGASRWIVFPSHGPSDVARGYARIPDFSGRLRSHGFQVGEQARFSPAMSAATWMGLSPPYDEHPVAGLVIRSQDGTLLYDATARFHRFQRYEDVPEIVVQALLLMEDRQLGRGPANPAVDWERLVRAAVLSMGNRLGFRVPFQGGSTLAVQIEKFRHSDGGRTGSLADKVRQITSASLRAHRGPDIAGEPQQIILDYLNSVPLGGAPAYGEVHGLGEGLRAWFGLDPDEMFNALRKPWASAAQARALKHVLALLCGVRAPSYLLASERDELRRRVEYYQGILTEQGLISPALARRLRATPIEFAAYRPPAATATFEDAKAANAVRRELLSLLPVRDLNELDHLDLEVQTTIDAGLQTRATELLRRLERPEYVAAEGLRSPLLLSSGDPSRVAYTLLLFERGTTGDAVRLQADNLDQPFDLNSGMRMELGSTAKLRTLAHYLEVVERLHHELARRSPQALTDCAANARDPITRWAALELALEPYLAVEGLLERSLERKYSANPSERFFTGGGTHQFHNFSPDDDGQFLTIHEAFVRSTNLVFIRIMRDLVQYEAARLPYDADAVLNDSQSPERTKLLIQAADDEARVKLERAYRRLRGTPPEKLPSRVLGRNGSVRDLALVYGVWHPGTPAESLTAWFATHHVRLGAAQARRLAESYGRQRLGLFDSSYLLDCDPLALWCAGQLEQRPEATLEEMVAGSATLRGENLRRLFQASRRGTQDMRLMMRVERDAFARMTGDWQRLGFPFSRLVPSLATAIGSSADRPEALAELIGIIVHEGVRHPPRCVTRLTFGRGSPYETTFQPDSAHENRIMSAPVAATLHKLLAEVVERGTARRLSGAFRHRDGQPIEVGGKTGSGDNRCDVFARGGRLVKSTAVNRTAAFAFYLGDRYYGVVTASVAGRESERYAFTSALTLEVLRRMAPAICDRLDRPTGPVTVTEAPLEESGRPLPAAAMHRWN